MHCNKCQLLCEYSRYCGLVAHLILKMHAVQFQKISAASVNAAAFGRSKKGALVLGLAHHGLPTESAIARHEQGMFTRHAYQSFLTMPLVQ